MEIIPKTNLKVDPKKPAFHAGEVCNIKKDIAEDLISRGLATEPAIESTAEVVVDESGEADSENP